jgi:hypothetical protein
LWSPILLSFHAFSLLVSFPLQLIHASRAHNIPEFLFPPLNWLLTELGLRELRVPLFFLVKFACRIYPLFTSYMSHVCSVTAIAHHPHHQVWYDIYSGEYGETRNSCLLSVENKWNGSRHLVLWSLGTLTGLRDRVRRLVA